MPEEINRILTDAIADFLFAFDNISVSNLINEGIVKTKIFLVGDIMLDSLKYGIEKIKNDNSILNFYNLKPNNYE